MYIVAECGINHNGYPQLTKKMMDSAEEAGCNAVKFQAYKTDRLIGVNCRDWPRRCEFSKDYFWALMEACRIDFICSVFDIESAEMMNELGLEIFKIPSGQITDYKLLERVRSFGKDVVISTGMSTLDEIRTAVEIVQPVGILHCVSAYPTNFGDVNLRAIKTLKNYFYDIPIGFSDHTLGIEAPIAATALGAEILEKHFTLDKTMEGPDHEMSIEPEELKDMVKAVRNIEKALGDGEKRIVPSEAINRKFKGTDSVSFQSADAGA